MSDHGIWVVSTTLAKPDAETQKLIRSHAMRGKNTRKVKDVRRLTRLMDNYDSEWGIGKSPRGIDDPEEAEWIPRPARKIASELSLFDLAIEKKPYILELLHRAFTTIKPSTYAIETAIVDGTRDDMICFSSIQHEPAMIHSILFVAQSLYDSLSQAPCNKIAQYHFGQTLKLLQEKLSNKNIATTKTTLIIVLTLASASAMLGDVGNTQKHMDGLYQIISLRGGLDSLGPGSMIEHKAQRIDFALALATGGKTRFFREGISWGPNIALDQAPSHCPELSMLHPHLDPRLLCIWADLKEFAKVANMATQTGVKMSSGFFSRLTTSIPYRLVRLQYDPLSAPELLRLCMLAFTKCILIQVKGLGKHLTYLATSLKTTLLAHRSLSIGGVTPPLLIWAVFMTAFSIYEDFDSDWLCEIFTSSVLLLGVRTWLDMKAVLRKFLWIDLVYDKQAELLFQQWHGKENEIRG
ncbi:hypothetical protein F4810DRAFT_678056 [Camillea tinctor]|nr:hypothetical protein F4810DRAFT_678056 [Camillea tinctor]